MSTSPSFHVRGRFFRRREIWLPTWRGWLLVLLIVALTAAALFLGAYPFLAVDAPRSSGAVVLEGWVSKYTVPLASAAIARHSYAPCYATGGPIEEDSPLGEYETYAQLGAYRLQQSGVASVIAVPCPYVRKDRTYTSAVELRRWMQAHGGVPRDLTIFTQGVHARRSRLLFEKAFGEGTTIGVIAAPPRAFDPRRWFTSSEGVREVIGEAVAYGYARLFFWPAKAE